MSVLTDLLETRDEVLQMEFSYEQVHRLMFLSYQVQDTLNSGTPIPNKDIALHQVNKLIDNDILCLAKSDKDGIEAQFKTTKENFLLALQYFANN